jgi:hypothetical protein
MSTRIAALVVAFLLIPMVRGRAQSAGLSGGILFAPNAARQVTLSRNGVLLTSMTTPRGTFLRASYDEGAPKSIAERRWEFHGEFALRVLPAIEAASRPAGEGLSEQLMRRAPLLLTAQGVDVVIENVP